MSDESEPPSPPVPRPSPRGRARPSMGGSGLYGTPQPATTSPITNSGESPDISEMIQQVTTQPSAIPTSGSLSPTPSPIVEVDPQTVQLFSQIGTRIHMDGLIRSHGGVLAQLDPNSPGIAYMSKKGTILSNISIDDILSSNLGTNASSEAPENHRLIFVLLAQHSLNNPGKAAVILAHSPWTLAASSHEDSFVLDSKKVGRIAVLDVRTEDEMISEITEALNQIGGPAIIIRNQFILGVGSDFESIATNLAILEHEMQTTILHSRE